MDIAASTQEGVYTYKPHCIHTDTSLYKVTMALLTQTRVGAAISYIHS